MIQKRLYIWQSYDDLVSRNPTINRVGGELQEDDCGNMSQSRIEKFGVYLEEMPERIHFQSHG